MQPHALLWFVCGFRFDLVGILDDSFGIFTLFTGTKAKACSLSSGALWFSRWNCKFESAVSLAEVFTIHFSKSKRCGCVKSLRITSLRSSLGNCFNKPYIFTISRLCLPSIGDSEVCPPSYLPSKPVSFLPHFRVFLRGTVVFGRAFDPAFGLRDDDHEKSELEDSLKFPGPLVHQMKGLLAKTTLEKPQESENF